MICKYQRGNVCVYWGDAIQALSELIPDYSVHLIFDDPPYNIGKQFSQFVDTWESDEAYAEWRTSQELFWITI